MLTNIQKLQENICDGKVKTLRKNIAITIKFFHLRNIRM